MNYHDYHLKGYEVSDFGKQLILHLVYDYPGQPPDASRIEFGDVSLYHFTHTAGAIITDIEETPLAQVLSELTPLLERWARQQGIDGWTGNAGDYLERLQQRGQHAWAITSAIGFSGFVIAGTVKQVTTPS